MNRAPQTSGGLNLPKDVGVSETTANAITNAWATIERVNARMCAKGLDSNPEPTIECPVVTAEALLTPDIKEYTTVYAAQLRWYNYVVVLLADVRAILLEVENAMEDIASSKRLTFKAANAQLQKNDKMSEKEMADHIFQDPYYKNLNYQKQILEQERIKLDAKSDTLERNMKTVSRQIENRRTESNGGMREGNMPGAATGSWEARQGRRPG
jgi:hypothetical protein